MQTPSTRSQITKAALGVAACLGLAYMCNFEWALPARKDALPGAPDASRAAAPMKTCAHCATSTAVEPAAPTFASDEAAVERFARWTEEYLAEQDAQRRA